MILVSVLYSFLFVSGYYGARPSFNVLFGLFHVGIGAGLESMTANPMAWEGDVNPKVLSFLSLFLYICVSRHVGTLFQLISLIRF